MIKYAIIVLLAGTLLYGCKNPLESMPDFELLLPDSTTILNTRNIPKDKISILIHFESDCLECQAQTSDILKNMDSLKSIQFYFLTTERFQRLSVFNKHYKIVNYPNIIAGQDFEKFFPKFIQIPSTPLLAVYDKNKKLRMVFNGRINAQELISALKKIQ